MSLGSQTFWVPNRTKPYTSSDKWSFVRRFRALSSSGRTPHISCIHDTKFDIYSPHFSTVDANSSSRALGYCNTGCPGQGLLLRSDCDLLLTGWVVILDSSVISWKTKKQHTVSRSSTEAEYRSMATITAELKWIKALLDVHHNKSMTLFCDRQFALHIAQNPIFHKRTKHIDVDCHYVRDAIQDGLIATAHVSLEEQLADIFTKALGKRKFLYLYCKLGICDLHVPT
ncbi:hypothetical protein LIER_11824 [Lithospermum erythrorhizon]|uniref:Uncharacterized protein n=1 Tax=Lithospermum erythrorhizon TaxID=34254 RepID=A0AAV3PRT3_LITER